MIVMQINVYYKEGSTGSIVYLLHDYLNQHKIESYVVYGNGAKTKQNNIYKVSNKITRYINTVYTYLSGYMYKGSLLSTLRTIYIIKKVKPNIVHVHCVNGHMTNIYILLGYLKRNNIKTIVTQHAEFFYTGSYTHVPEASTQWLNGSREKLIGAKKLTNSWFFNKTYQSITKMKSIFRDFENLTIVSVSPWLTNRSMKSYVMQNKQHLTILNGIDTNNIFYPRVDDELREKLGIVDRKIILHVTSGFDNPIKGSIYMIKIAERLKGEDIVFLFIGVETPTISLPNNCINLGVIKNANELAKYYSISDLCVITSKVETFSLVVAESLSCGTPVVGFKSGGPESIAIAEFSSFVEFGDIDGLVNEIQHWTKYKNNNRGYISKKAHELYSSEIMAHNYFQLYEKCFNKEDKY